MTSDDAKAERMPRESNARVLKAQQAALGRSS
jgi:hypothetical protein